jgi:hypothetical protein
MADRLLRPENSVYIRAIRQPDRFSTFAARVHHHHRESWKQIYLSAMWASFAAKLKRGFHLTYGLP